MTTSSYCELRFARQGAAPIAFAVADWEVPKEPDVEPVIKAGEHVELTLERGGADAVLRLCIEGVETFHLTADRPLWTVQLADYFADEHGLATIAVEEESSHEPGSWSPVLTLTIRVEAPATFLALFDALVAELDEVHLLLARDFVSRTWHRGQGGAAASRLNLEDEISILDEVYRRLERALERIAKQPSRALRRERVRAAWRAGDRLTPSTVTRLARDGSLRRDASGRLVPPERAFVERRRLDTDIEEHRHLRAGLARLRQRSAAVARHARRTAELVGTERRRWSGDALEQRVEPRIKRLEELAERADSAEQRFRRLSSRLQILEEAGDPRTRLGPTPIFLGRVPYREAYRGLRTAQALAATRYDGEGLRVRFRNVSTLYEYWLFIKVVELLRDLYGRPEGRQAFTLIDEVYRPELAPGQEFRFPLPLGVSVTATYEPDFPPGSGPSARPYRAALSTGVLRPDVTVEVRRGDEPSVILVLDAKASPRFTKITERLQKTAGYVWLIHDPHTGHQPVRQLFLVHRDTQTAPASNLPGYLEGRLGAVDARVLGAVPAIPGAVEPLRNVVIRFLETFGAARSSHQRAVRGASRPSLAADLSDGPSPTLTR